MAFNLNVFGYRGFKQIPTVHPHQHSETVNLGFFQPYEFRQQVVSAGATPVATAPTAAPDLTALLYVEIPSGNSIRYEVKPPGSTRVVDASSPLMAASDWVSFSQGWTFQFIEGP